MLKPLAAAFSMYSIIPMPYIEWDEKTMRYAFCFFPFVGAVIGFAEYIMFVFLERVGIGIILRASIASVIPVIISGGIHIDGFMDTADAIGSHAERAKKLEIMKDPHSGVFAIISIVVYMMIYAGLFSEIKKSELLIYALGFFISRALSGFFLMVFPKARKDGLAVVWSNMTDKKVAYILLVELIVCLAFIIIYGNITGIIIAILISAVSVFHYFLCKNTFGGITGDIAGFFLQIVEMAVLLGCVIGGRL